jgi:hypothetical protein
VRRGIPADGDGRSHAGGSATEGMCDTLSS